MGHEKVGINSLLILAFTQKTKIFSKFPVTSNLTAHMHGALNIDEKKLITQFTCKSQNESFKSS